LLMVHGILKLEKETPQGELLKGTPLGPKSHFFWKGMDAMSLKNVIVPVDFSENAMLLLDYAQDFSKTAGSRLRLLHVLEMTPYDVYQQLGIFDSFPSALLPGHETEDISPQGIMEQAAKEAHNKLDEVAKKHGLTNYEVRVRIGKFIPEILDEIKTNRPDLVLMCTHGWTGLTHLLMGSNTEKFVRISPVPVLTMRGKQ